MALSNESASNAVELSPSAPSEFTPPPDTAHQQDEEPSIHGSPAHVPLPRSLEWSFYLSHFLSTWNFRSFEFASVLFLAHIYPSTLLYLSIYAIVRSASAIFTSPVIGRAIDTYGRLGVVRGSIVLGRLSVLLSALGFWGLWEHPLLTAQWRLITFVAIVLLACAEKAAFIMNTVAVERDWVVIIADSDEASLQKLNARMRRIDLICKLVGPLAISLVDGGSTTAAIWLTVALNALSLPVEYFAIARVYTKVPKLRIPKTSARSRSVLATTWSPKSCITYLQSLVESFPEYFQHPACLPSFSLALLYLTVLSFGGQMVTYLLSAGYTSFIIALVRSLSVIVEITATWIAPRAMARLGATRAGMWFLSWQVIWLAGAVSFFWSESSPLIAASALSGGTIISRVGLWGYDLCAQTTIQNEVRDTNRGSFSSTEQLFQNVFELLSYVLTIAASQPDQFRYPVLVSAAATFVAGGLYASHLRRKRGHLLHVPCAKPGFVV